MMTQPHYPFTPGSFWLEPPSDRQPALSSTQSCDVAVIGGGYTGMAAALALRQQGADVVLLEGEFCGAGASGRNAGHVTPTIGKDTITCLKTFGVERALQLVGFAEAAIDFLDGVIGRYGIDCDYVRHGNIIAGLHEAHRKPLQRSAELGATHGLQLHYLDDAAMRQRQIPPAFRFGVHEARGGVLHTGKYVAGLRTALLGSGVRVHEDSRVRRIERGPTLRFHTEDGVLSAGKALLATNAYTTSEFGLLKSKILPVRASLFVTRRLTDRELASLGWPNREGLYTAHELLENYRLTNDDRLLGGSKEIAYAYGSKLAEGYQPHSFALLETVFRERFPMLRAVPIETFWGGWIALTLDFLPIWGWLGAERNLAYYSGCNGHGIPQCTFMGDVMGRVLLGAASPWTALLTRRSFPLPPEPIRTATVKGLNWYYARRDRKIDAALRAGLSSAPSRGQP